MSFRLLALAAVCAMAGHSPAQPNPTTARPSTLRVGLWTLWHDKNVTIAPVAHSTGTLRECVGDACASKPFSEKTSLQAHGNQLAHAPDRFADALFLAGNVILSAHNESITLHNPVRISARNGELLFIVTLPIESYVERVVASESGPADTFESLKALAIVVRSFALHQAHGHADYDLCDSTHCQYLHWSSSDHVSQAHAATLFTAGETLWFHRQRAVAWFHQNCGGRTALPSEIWSSTKHGREIPQTSMPWLVSRADPYCSANGPREWSTAMTLAELTSALASDGLVPPGWTTFTVARRGDSGRAVTLLIGGTTVSAEDFRLAVGRAFGWGRILSTWFEVSRQGDQFFFHGRGSGHGVGLCQAGSAAMSAQGHGAAEIIAQYFPGAEIADESTGLAWDSLHAQGFTLETLNAADKTYLPQLSQALAEAQSLSGLQSAPPITVRAFRSTPSFRDETLMPGWVAAFTEGNFIATQPLATLTTRKLLASTLRHEFLHALIESQSTPATPLWLREGLVEAWADSQGAHHGGSANALALSAAQIDSMLQSATTESQSQVAHHAAALRARGLLDRYGRAQVLTWLRSGLPANLPSISQ